MSFRWPHADQMQHAELTNYTIPGVMYSTTPYRDASRNIRTDQLANVVANAGGGCRRAVYRKPRPHRRHGCKLGDAKSARGR